MKVKSYAKINLALDVLKKSGKYHQIQTVFQQIDLYDELIFRKTANQKVAFHCAHPGVPVGSSNSIIKAVSLLKKVIISKKSLQKNITGLHITLKKNIPISAGLGGGSSNAAATLLALNTLWKLRLPPKTLQRLGAKIGMDVPFFLKGGAALGTHYGEKITQLPALQKLHIILALNGKKISTKKMYQQLNRKKTGLQVAKTKALISALKNKKYTNILKYLHNDFETTREAKRRAEAKVDNLRKKLLRTNPIVVQIAGSGPTLYALYKTRKAQQEAFKKLKGEVTFLWPSL